MTEKEKNKEVMKDELDNLEKEIHKIPQVDYKSQLLALLNIVRANMTVESIMILKFLIMLVKDFIANLNAIAQKLNYFDKKVSAIDEQKPTTANPTTLGEKMDGRKPKR